MLKKHRKNVLQSKSIRIYKYTYIYICLMEHDPLQNKSKRRISKQGVLEKQTKIFHTLAHLDQVA
jgi:hypothetical protein